MVLLIEEFHAVKSYRLETLYLAVSIADRYLKQIRLERKEDPCFISLAVICILLAAKLEESFAPSFIRMINLLNDQHEILLEKQDLLNLEESVVQTLNFSLRHVSPIHFLDRFHRLFELDQDKNDITAKLLSGLATQYCRFMQRESLFLKYKPSAIAAAALIFAINISQSKVSQEVLGLERIDTNKLEVSLNEAA